MYAMDAFVFDRYAVTLIYLTLFILGLWHPKYHFGCFSLIKSYLYDIQYTILNKIKTGGESTWPRHQCCPQGLACGPSSEEEHAENDYLYTFYN